MIRSETPPRTLRLLGFGAPSSLRRPAGGACCLGRHGRHGRLGRLHRLGRAQRLPRGLHAILLLASVAMPLRAQPPDEPLESPKAVVSQVLGVRPITVTYWSPGVKDREIWGELVPFGQNWRAGANGKTTFEFPEPVLIGEQRLEAGTYGFYVLPHDDERWELILNRDPTGSPNEFDPEDDVLRHSVKPQDAPFRERLQYAIENFSDWPPFTAEIALHWERRRVVLPVELAPASTDGGSTDQDE